MFLQGGVEYPKLDQPKLDALRVGFSEFFKLLVHRDQVFSKACSRFSQPAVGVDRFDDSQSRSQLIE